MKQLKFDHKYAQAIIEGKKRATFRVNDDKDIRPGDVVEIVHKIDRDRPATWTIPGELEITQIDEVPIGDLTEQHLRIAESFDSIDEMIQTFRRFYGDYIDDHTRVRVLSFNFRPFEHPRPFIVQPSAGNIPQRVLMYADGGSRGNPGPSALGFVIMDEDTGEMVHADGKYLGLTTNNQAEYHAVIAGMEWCKSQGIRELSVRLDSMLVVNQMNGVFKVKNRDLWSLYERASDLKSSFRKVNFRHVPREMNKLADKEVNKALDAVKSGDVVQ